MRYLSVCSGIEAASTAWHPLGWEPVGFSEIEKFPSSVLAHRYPGVPNFGDFTKIPLAELGHVDLLVGGTPCQAFSVAGKRLSLDDARGNLTLAYVVLAHELAGSHGLRWAVWENVPGVLSTKDNAFGCFLSALVGGDDPFDLPKGIDRWPDAGLVAGPRARVAWRILDAQYFGLAQRRRRVFVVASFGDDGDPAAVLLERQGLQRNPPSRSQTRQGVTHATAPCLTSSGRGVERTGETRGQDPVVAVEIAQPYEVGNCLTARMYKGINSSLDEGQTPVLCVTGDRTHALTTAGKGGNTTEDGTGRGCPIVPAVAYRTTGNDGVYETGDLVGALTTATDPNGQVVCVHADAVGRSGDALTPSPDAEGRIRLRPPGIGVIDDGTAYNLMASGQPHAVAFSCKDYGADATTELAPTMRAMGFDDSHANGGGQLAVAFDILGTPATTGARETDLHTSLRARAPGASEASTTTVVAQPYTLAIRGRGGEPTLEARQDGLANALLTPNGGRGGIGVGAVAFDTTQITHPENRSNPQPGDPCHPLAAHAHPPAIANTMAVRRLTPRECERLQGFPDDYTLIPVGNRMAADGPRYKALGNSMAVPCMFWIGNRINQQEK